MAETSHNNARVRLPETRYGLTHKGAHGPTEYYLNLSFYPDGRPGEVFIHIAKEGSDVAGAWDTWAMTLSLLLQHGASWAMLKQKYLETRFGADDPSHLFFDGTRGSSPSILHSFVRDLDDMISAWQRVRAAA
jgi:hypothetical protein